MRNFRQVQNYKVWMIVATHHRLGDIVLALARSVLDVMAAGTSDVSTLGLNWRAGRACFEQTVATSSHGQYLERE